MTRRILKILFSVSFVGFWVFIGLTFAYMDDVKDTPYLPDGWFESKIMKVFLREGILKVELLGGFILPAVDNITAGIVYTNTTDYTTEDINIYPKARYDRFVPSFVLMIVCLLGFIFTGIGVCLADDDLDHRRMVIRIRNAYRIQILREASRESPRDPPPKYEDLPDILPEYTRRSTLV